MAEIFRNNPSALTQMQNQIQSQAPPQLQQAQQFQNMPNMNFHGQVANGQIPTNPQASLQRPQQNMSELSQISPQMLQALMASRNNNARQMSLLAASRQPHQNGMQNFNQHGVPLAGQQNLNQFPFQTNGAFNSRPEDVRQGVMQGQGQQTMAQQQVPANGTIANPMVANTLPNSNSIQSSSELQRKLQMVKQEIDLERQRLVNFKAANPNADSNPLFKQRLNNLQQRETLFKSHLMALHRQGAGNSQIQQGLPPPPPPTSDGQASMYVISDYPSCLWDLKGEFGFSIGMSLGFLRMHNNLVSRIIIG